MDRSERRTRDSGRLVPSFREAYDTVLAGSELALEEKQLIRYLLETPGLRASQLEPAQLAALWDIFGFIFESGEEEAEPSVLQVALWAMFQKSNSVQRRVERVLGIENPDLLPSFDSGSYTVKSLSAGFSDMVSSAIKRPQALEPDVPLSDPQRGEGAVVVLHGIELDNSSPGEDFRPVPLIQLTELSEKARVAEADDRSYAQRCAVQLAQQHLEHYRYWFDRARGEATELGTHIEVSPYWGKVVYHQGQIEEWARFASRLQSN